VFATFYYRASAHVVDNVFATFYYRASAH